MGRVRRPGDAVATVLGASVVGDVPEALAAIGAETVCAGDAVVAEFGIGLGISAPVDGAVTGGNCGCGLGRVWVGFAIEGLASGMTGCLGTGRRDHGVDGRKCLVVRGTDVGHVGTGGPDAHVLSDGF